MGELKWASLLGNDLAVAISVGSDAFNATLVIDFVSVDMLRFCYKQRQSFGNVSTSLAE